MPHARTRTRFASVLSTAAKLTADGTSMLAESGPETDRPLLLHNNDDKEETMLCSATHTFAMEIWRDPETGRAWVSVNFGVLAATSCASGLMNRTSSSAS